MAFSRRNAVAVADRHADVWASVGLHPHDAEEWTEDRWQRWKMASHPVVALGMGLDFHYDNSPRPIQQVSSPDSSCLRAGCRSSSSRDSDGETMAFWMKKAHGMAVASCTTVSRDLWKQ